MGSSSSGVVAGCFALSAFTIAILAGLGADNPASTILVRALAALIVCWPIGYLAGSLCRRVIEQHDPPPQDHEPSGDDAESAVPSTTDEPTNPSPAPTPVAVDPAGR